MKELKKLLFVLGVAVFFIGLFIFCDRYAQDIRDNYAPQYEAERKSSNSEQAASEVKKASDALPVESETVESSRKETENDETETEVYTEIETEQETEE